MIPFLLLVSFVRVSLSRIGDIWEKLIIKRFSSTICLGSRQAVGVEEDASRWCNPCVNGFNRSNMVSFTSFSRTKIPLADRN